MASDLTPATKVFAFSIYKRMYGTKVTSHPDTDVIHQDTGLAVSKYPAYRKALIEGGFLTGVKQRMGKFKQENYTYTLNLDSQSHVPTGKKPCTQKEEAVYPEGTSHVPTGNSNTTSNTTKKTTSKTTTEAPVVADAPTDTSPKLTLVKNDPPSSNQKPEDAVQSKETVNPTRVPTGNMAIDQVHDAAYWRAVRKERPLTQEEKEEINARSRAYWEPQRRREQEEREQREASAW